MAHKSLREPLRWTQRLLFAIAIPALAYCAYVLVDARIFQRTEHRRLEQFEQTRTVPVASDGLVGRLEIPRVGLSAIVSEGDDRITLRRGVGHIPGTGLPGQPGNVGIAGHRDSFFRPLRNVRENDLIKLTTLNGAFRYRVVSITIVSPADMDVLYPGKNEVLTLVTCYPFNFVGSAPDRYIVRAQRVT